MAQPSRSANDRNLTHRSRWLPPAIGGSPPNCELRGRGLRRALKVDAGRLLHNDAALALGTAAP
jgi:hypothetical protein